MSKLIHRQLALMRHRRLVLLAMVSLAALVLLLCNTGRKGRGINQQYATTTLAPMESISLLKNLTFLPTRSTILDYDEELLSARVRAPVLTPAKATVVLKEWFNLTQPTMSATNGLVVYSCRKVGCGGWADRIKGVLSAFLMAIFLQRHFAIDVVHPCDLTGALKPNLVKWNDVNVSAVKGPSRTFMLVGNNDDRNRFREMIENDTLSELSVYRKIYITGNDLLLDVLVKRYDQDRFGGIDKAYLRLDFFFPVAYDLLFRLTSLSGEQRAVLQTPQLICVQMRMGRSDTLPTDVEMVKSRHRERMFEEMMDFVEGKTNRSWKVFVTTDSEDARLRARQRLGKRMIEMPGDITHLDRTSAKKACANMKKVTLDFEMLSKCDVSLISNSGFAYFGNLRRSDPYSELYLYCRRIHKVNSKREWDVIRWKNQPC